MSSSRQITFIPGWGFQSSIAKNWLPMCAQLIDLPPIKGGYCTIETLCRSIEEKIQPKDSILMGWSLGGLIAVNLYNRQPNRYNALILMASTPCFWAQTDWPGISKEHQTLFTKNLNREYRVFLAYYLKLISEPFTLSKFSLKLQSYMIPNDDFNDYKSYQEILFQGDLRSEFSRIKIPTLVIQGGRDAIIPTEVTQYLMKLNPHLKYCVIPNAGHLPFITHQNEINKMITKFLKEFS